MLGQTGNHFSSSPFSSTYSQSTVDNPSQQRVTLRHKGAGAGDPGTALLGAVLSDRYQETAAEGVHIGALQLASRTD